MLAALLISVLVHQGNVSSATENDSEPRQRYVEYTASGTDRNAWTASVEGEVLFYNRNRAWKIFGNATVDYGGWSDDELYIAVRQNINRTTLDGRFYGLCESGGLDEPDIPCDRSLYQEDRVGHVYYYWIGRDDSGEYFTFRTRPGRGLRGIWVKVCHSVDGPDNCGQLTYVDNPYSPGTGV